MLNIGGHGAVVLLHDILAEGDEPLILVLPGHAGQPGERFLAGSVPGSPEKDDIDVVGIKGGHRIALQPFARLQGRGGIANLQGDRLGQNAGDEESGQDANQTELFHN